MIFKLKLLFLLFFLAFSVKSFSQGGSVVYDTIYSAALENNRLGDPARQQLAVYLPPTYYSSPKKYPVIYFLPGYGDFVFQWVDGNYLKLKPSLDDLIAKGLTDELIMVICPGRNLLGGSFYVNSEVTGNWDDLITKEIVRFVDSKYRTLDKRESRAIAGHSMGGFGALHLSMLHPDVFGICYALSPGVFPEEEAKSCQLFEDENMIRQMVQKQEEFTNGSGNHQVQLDRFKSYMFDKFNNGEWNAFFSYGYSCAFAPNIKKPVPSIDYPYYLKDGKLIEDSGIMAKYDEGYGGWKGKVEKHKSNLESLVGFIIEYGIHDEHEWITEGCRYYDQILTDAGIKHEVISFDGGHQDIVASRVKDHAIIRIAGLLEFE